ncbi:coproporphyrinogen dehydrogenase HemZ [Lagierella sp.]|uniref:coproporphyrinogen dehydrogenase HemZ n=1 Tax=Lagierella sp. TaxID=2849657 RepID=UPI0026327D4C|nr:coproporphyrinogen dehydrogenase HemZ [Lagierella sp.]
MNIYLFDQRYRLEVYETLSIFLPSDEIVFLDSISDDGLIIDTSNGIKIKYFVNGESFYENHREVESFNLDSFISFKMVLKYELVSFFKAFFNKSSPWGILTGIRPVKVATALLETRSRELSLDYLENKMLLSPEKAKLILDISNTQGDIREKITKNSYSLYINIPFCTGRCSYCSYSTLILEKNGGIVKPYIKSMLKEIGQLKKSLEGRKLSTIYIGGGTPTSLKAEDLRFLLEGVNKIFDLEEIEEFTVEAGREDSLSLEKLKILKDNKVTRISLNPQSFKPNTLLEIGRRQDNSNLIRMYEEARNLDFDSINMDLIIGLPKEDLDDFNKTLEVIKSLSPDNLTVHALALKKGSKLLQDNDNLQKEYLEAEKMMERALEFGKSEGYVPYYLYRQKRILGNLENIGFSKPDKICKYNIYMMEELQDIIGVGMGSSSKFLKGNNRFINHRNFMNMRDYLEKLEDIIEEKRELIQNEK